MGCGSSSEQQVVVQPPPTSGGAPPAYSAPVPLPYARDFIRALQAEYVAFTDGAVGAFFDEVPDAVTSSLDPYEQRVQQANDKQKEIDRIQVEWNMPGFGRPVSQTAVAPYAGGGPGQAELPPNQGHVPSGPGFAKELATNPEMAAAILSEKLGAPRGTPFEQLASQALSHPDLEVRRSGLTVAYHLGQHGQPEVVAAEGALRDERQLPSDWNMQSYAAGRFLTGGMGGRQESTVIAFETQPQHVVDEVQAMFDDTYRKVYTRDRRGAPIPDRFVVREVQRVMNDQVWREYLKTRQDLRKKFGGETHAVPDGAHTMNSLQNRRKARAGAAGLPPLDASVNEVWLYHGTTRDAAQGIAENDFRLDLTGSNAGTLYGKGIYLAENATKSDEYGEGPRGPAGEEQMEAGYEAPRPPPGPPPELVRESYILLCRSTLGKMRYTAEAKPDADDLQKTCLDGQYDSVLGDRLKIHGTFRELIVYNDDHVYPEYIIRYERIFFHERFAEIYKAMSRRKQLDQFNGPTPQEAEVLTSMWNIYGMPNRGRINKWQLLDLLTAIKQPPENENEDLDATFTEWDTKKDGWIDAEEFMQEMTQRVHDGMIYYDE